MTRIEQIVTKIRRETEILSTVEAIALQDAIHGLSEALKKDPQLNDLEKRIGSVIVDAIHRLASYSKE